MGAPTTMTLIIWSMAIVTDAKSSRALMRIATASDQELYSRGKTSSDITPFVFLSVLKTHGIWERANGSNSQTFHVAKLVTSVASI
jgi:hypothetical protein